VTAPLPPHEQVQVDPDVGIPGLIRRLTDDSKRLVSDEVRLATLEMRESAHTGARGALWLAVAFGIGVVALGGATIFLVSLIGYLANGHMWIGAIVTGVIELALAGWLIKRGISAFAKPSYTLEESRAALKDTAAWVSHPRAD
jgi:hypothetical protein